MDLVKGGPAKLGFFLGSIHGYLRLPTPRPYIGGSSPDFRGSSRLRSVSVWAWTSGKASSSVLRNEPKRVFSVVACRGHCTLPKQTTW